MSEPGEPLVVPAALVGERLDRAVALLTGWSRSEVQSLIDGEAVLVAGKPCAKSRRLVAGELIELLEAPAVEVMPGPEPVAVDVRYADDHVIVVDKPAGLVVHPGPGHEHGTLVHGLLHRFPELVDVGERARPGIVHRLDRDTSGLMVVARSDLAYEALVDALRARSVERRYQTLVWGTPESLRGVIDAPIGRSTRRRTRMAVRESGRAARTGYEVRGTWSEPAVSLLFCSLETGRTHQIRVHLAAIGHPVVGDGPYGGNRPGLEPGRPFLHADRLAFVHPATGEEARFEAALPGELEAILGDLGPSEPLEDEKQGPGPKKR